MLKDTLVIWGGEFGRTPTARTATAAITTTRASPCGSPAAASRAASSYGETDEYGAKAVTDKIHIHDLHATILRCSAWITRS